MRAGCAGAEGVEPGAVGGHVPGPPLPHDQALHTRPLPRKGPPVLTVRTPCFADRPTSTSYNQVSDPSTRWAGAD